MVIDIPRIRGRLQTERGHPAAYIPRRDLDARMQEALSGGRHVVLYGPPSQGKTALLSHNIKFQECCVIDCRSDLKRSDIYRILLANSGFSVTVNTKKKGRLGGKATLKVFGSSASAEAGGETESL